MLRRFRKWPSFSDISAFPVPESRKSSIFRSNFEGVIEITNLTSIRAQILRITRKWPSFSGISEIHYVGGNFEDLEITNLTSIRAQFLRRSRKWPPFFDISALPAPESRKFIILRWNFEECFCLNISSIGAQILHRSRKWSPFFDISALSAPNSRNRVFRWKDWWIPWTTRLRDRWFSFYRHRTQYKVSCKTSNKVALQVTTLER